jgi:cyanophycinase
VTGRNRILLIGGGRETDLGPLFDVLPARPTIAVACVATAPDPWVELLTAAAPCTTVPFDPAAPPDADAVFVAGGLTPAYAHVLVPHAATLRAWLSAGRRVYAGFSAGAAIAARTAVVGGWLAGGIPVCDPDTAEDLDEVAVRPGLDLVPFAVEVHAAQWGTLNRLVTAVHRGLLPYGVAVDEDTILVVAGDRATVAGRGQIHLVRAAGPEVRLHPLPAGSVLSLDDLS